MGHDSKVEYQLVIRKRKGKIYLESMCVNSISVGDQSYVTMITEYVPVTLIIYTNVIVSFVEI